MQDHNYKFSYVHVYIKLEIRHFWKANYNMKTDKIEKTETNKTPTKYLTQIFRKWFKKIDEKIYVSIFD